MLGMGQELAGRLDLVIDQAQAPRGHEIGVGTDRVFRQFLRGILPVLLFDESPAHMGLFFSTPPDHYST